MSTVAATLNKHSTPPLAPILQPIATEMRAVDRLIRARLDSDVTLIRSLGDYIVDAGGKRLRPASVLLAGRACGQVGDGHVLLAAIIELIHTATLLHDDVVDNSELRRGHATASAVWGNSASVLTGDFLYSRSFQMMVELQRMEVMQVLSDATNRIAEGEVLQLMHAHNPEISEANYLEVIDRKTATLFAAGCRLAAALADAPEGHKTALQAYGRHLGLAFQLIDDALDYDADSPQFGKNVGDDLAEGKVTLPLIRALEIADPVRAEALRAAIRSGDNGKLDMVRETIESTQAMTYTCARADDEIQQALAALDGIPDSSSKTALQQLAEFSIRRSF